ncbi:hypothetical protein CN286_08355 [Bacillus anthracis]|nr:hypothetical protein CN286_08355 [Bacillus anthracis]PFM48603.1 hypothetical protein COJ45_09315 [Bacillus cereus]PGS21255.1 hypothetical protein COC59_22665 [Bacillus cereus]
MNLVIWYIRRKLYIRHFVCFQAMGSIFPIACFFVLLPFVPFEIFCHIAIIEIEIYGKGTKTKYVYELVMIKN